MHSPCFLKIENGFEVSIFFDSSYEQIEIGNSVVWLKSNYSSDSKKKFLKYLEAEINFGLSQEKFKTVLSKSSGRFSLIIKTPHFCAAAVDKLRIYPLYFLSPSKGNVIISTSFAPLVKPFNLTFNETGILEIAMAGYTIGRDTIYQGLSALQAGDFMFVDNVCSVEKYYCYKPRNFKDANRDDLSEQLSDLTLKILEEIFEANKAKLIYIPLSAGIDSRLIVSGLKEIGAKNIKCFSYGQAGNFEAEVAKKISKRLGYEWQFVELNIKKQRTFQKSEVFSTYYKGVDSGLSVPFYQDVAALYYLSQVEKLGKDTIFINGNTGDFISGGHIQEGLRTFQPDSISNLINIIIKKHFSLWGTLKSSENLEVLKIKIENQIREIISLDGSRKDEWCLFECFEFLNRQSKYVISGQLNYEFYNSGWELPLWDQRFVDFWATVPFDFKKGQALYKYALKKNNWGNVWQDIPINQIKFSSDLLKNLRLLMKFLSIPLGEKGWHRIDRRLFAYHTEILGLYAPWSYWEIFSNKNEPRNILSWLSKKYLDEKRLEAQNGQSVFDK